MDAQTLTSSAIGIRTSKSAPEPNLLQRSRREHGRARLHSRTERWERRSVERKPEERFGEMRIPGDGFHRSTSAMRGASRTSILRDFTPAGRQPARLASVRPGEPRQWPLSRSSDASPCHVLFVKRPVQLLHSAVCVLARLLRQTPTHPRHAKTEPEIERLRSLVFRKRE